MIRVALDAMGGDHGVDIVVPAAFRALDAHPYLQVILVGDEPSLTAKIRSGGYEQAQKGRVRIRHASQIVEMDDPVAEALRRKKDSSMQVAVDLVKSGEAGACVSAGNTGALMATARFVLKTLPGIDRPAICTEIPSMYGSVHMLDLGANVDSSAEHLMQFAYMGAELVSAVEGIAQPKVALLNIGHEDIKGNDTVKAAARLLEASDLNYRGFVEGHDVFLSEVDVVVSDGFAGNVALKTAEGVARFIGKKLKTELTQGVYNRLAGWVAAPVLKGFYKQLDPRRYNGASLLGLRGIVVKSHGGADRLAYAHAIELAVREVEKAVPSRIRERWTARAQDAQNTVSEPSFART